MPHAQSYKSCREEAKLYYKSIGFLICPAIRDEKVYFQNAGFKHLIYKEKRFRPIADQMRRFKALYYVKEILLGAGVPSEYREEKGNSSTARFWAFGKIINGRYIHIILRKINNGPLHFFSVRSEQNTKTPEGV